MKITNDIKMNSTVVSFSYHSNAIPTDRIPSNTVSWNFNNYFLDKIIFSSSASNVAF